MKLNPRYSMSLIRACGLALSLIPSAWAQFAGGSGTPSDPYRIATAAQLDAVRNNLAASYVLSADIDLSSIDFAPIGPDQFSGTFDGANHSIAHWNCHYQPDGYTYVGLFRALSTTGRIQRLNLVDCHLNMADTGGWIFVGLLAGSSDGTIDSCSASGTIDATNQSGYVGGIVGSSAVLLNSHAAVDIIAPNGGYCGGLAGTSGAVVRDCYASGNITGYLGSDGWTNTGGLIGSAGGVIERCHATGSVEGPSGVGGLVGTDYGSISKCYATGTVICTLSSGSTGGLAGEADGFVGDCYSTATVDATQTGGGGASLVGASSGQIVRCYALGAVLPLGDPSSFGVIANAWGTVSDCFWNPATTGTNVGGVDSGASGLTTAQLQNPATYSAWDSTRVWVLSVGQYPSLRSDGKLLPQIGALPDAPAGVANQTFTMTASVLGEGPFSYQWSLFGTPLSDATSATLTIPNFQYENRGDYMVTVSNSVGYASADVWVEMAFAPTFTAPLSDLNAILGGTIQIDSNVSVAGGPISFQWYKNGIALAGQNGSSLVISPAQTSDNGVYTVTATNAAGSITSNGATVAVYPWEPVVLTLPQGAVLNPGDAYTLSASVVGFPPMTYQWMKDGYPVQGATNATYTIPSATIDNTGVYFLSVRNPSVTWPYGYPQTTDNVSIELRIQPTLNAVYSSTYPGDPNLYVTLRGDNHEVGTQLLWNGAPIDFPQGFYRGLFQFSVPQSYIDSVGFAVVSVSVQNPGGFVSNALPLTLTSSNVTASQVTTAPPASSTSVSTTSAGNTPAAVSATLQNNGTVDTTIAVAAYNQQPPSLPVVQLGGQYLDVAVANAQPTDVATVQFYYPASITGTAETDLGLSYFDGTAWQPVSSSGGGAPVKNTTNNLDNTYSGGRFTVVFDNTSTPKITELTGTVFTAGPKLKKDAAKQKPTIVTQPADTKAHAGDFVSLTVVATSATKCTYQWYRDGKKDAIAGATAANYDIASFSAADAANYYVVITNAGGSVASAKAAVKLVPPAPVVTADPAAQSVNSGASATFTVTATGEGPLTYQWTLNGNTIAGANKANYTVAKATQADVGVYTAIVTNAGGSTTSGGAYLAVQSPSLNAIAPSTVAAGSAPFTLTVTGANFTAGDVVRWGADDLETTFVDGGTLTAKVPKNQLAPSKTTKTVAITVRAPGGDTSTPGTITVTASK